MRICGAQVCCVYVNVSPQIRRKGGRGGGPFLLIFNPKIQLSFHLSIKTVIFFFSSFLHREFRHQEIKKSIE